MRVIHKYEMSAYGATSAPNGRVVLVAQQHNQEMPTVWIEYDPSNYTFTNYVVIGTGQQWVNDQGEHVGSAVCGPFVWHVYRGPVV